MGSCVSRYDNECDEKLPVVLPPAVPVSVNPDWLIASYNETGFVMEKSTAKESFVPQNVSDLPSEYWKDQSVEVVVFEPGSNLQSLASLLFFRSRLKSIHIPATIETICEQCFALCRQLTRVTFERGSRLKTIEKGALAQSVLREIEIPAATEVIGDECFKGCRSLASIRFEEGSCIQRLGRDVFRYSSITEILIPACLCALGRGCFYESGIERICFENCITNVKVLEGALFWDCGLSCITIPANIEVISASCFALCSKLRCVLFEAGSRLKTIERRAFESSAITEIDIPSGVETISEYCFLACHRLRCVRFQDLCLRRIEKGLFANSGLFEIEIPASIETICEMAFAGSAIRRVRFAPESQLKTIGEKAFAICKYLTDISIPVTVETIGKSCFLNCISLRSESVTDRMLSRESQLREIGSRAFDMLPIRSAYIPPHVNQIEDNPWPNCNIDRICSDSPLYTVSYGVLTSSTALITRVDSRQANENTSRVSLGLHLGSNELSFSLKHIQIPANIEIIGCSLFKYCITIITVSFERRSRLKRIGVEAFARSTLEEIEIPESTEVIEDCCFFDCQKLVKCSFAGRSQMKEIRDSAFRYCTSLRFESIPTGARISMLAFFGCPESPCFQKLVKRCRPGK